jgi:hypothetical protein
MKAPRKCKGRTFSSGWNGVPSITSLLEMYLNALRVKQGLDKNFKEDLTVNLPRQTSMFRVLRGVGRNFGEDF